MLSINKNSWTYIELNRYFLYLVSFFIAFFTLFLNVPQPKPVKQPLYYFYIAYVVFEWFVSFHGKIYELQELSIMIEMNERTYGWTKRSTYKLTDIGSISHVSHVCTCLSTIPGQSIVWYSQYVNIFSSA